MFIIKQQDRCMRRIDEEEMEASNCIGDKKQVQKYNNWPGLNQLKGNREHCS